MELLKVMGEFEVDEPVVECASEVVCASQDTSSDIDNDPIYAVVGLGCADASLDRAFAVEGEGKPNCVCPSDVESLMTIDGIRDGAMGTGFDAMALLMSLVSHSQRGEVENLTREGYLAGDRGICVSVGMTD